MFDLRAVASARAPNVTISLYMNNPVGTEGDRIRHAFSGVALRGLPELKINGMLQRDVWQLSARKV